MAAIHFNFFRRKKSQGSCASLKGAFGVLPPGFGAQDAASAVLCVLGQRILWR
jgi:hypothetical protein